MNLIGKRGLLKDVKRCLQISDLGGGLPYQWSKSQNQLEAKSISTLYLIGIRLGVATFYTIVQFVQGYKVLDESTSLMVITHSIMYIISAVLILSCEFTNYFKLSGVVNLFNGFIQVEQNFAKYLEITKQEPNQNHSTNGWYLRGMLYFLTFTGLVYPVFYAGDILRNPCFPAYAGYWLNTQCEDDKLGFYLEPTWSLQEVLTKAALSLSAYILWAPFIAGWLYIMCLEYVVEGNCFRANNEQFGKAFMRIRGDNIHDLRQLTLLYRQLQIMSIHYRLNLSQFQIGCAIPCLIAVQTACLNNTLSLISGKVIGGPLWYNLLYIWGEGVFFCTVMFVFGILADVCNVSNGVQDMIDGNTDLKNNKWFRKWKKSCPGFKIYFGGSNFLDRLTPLNIQDFTINQTVSLMLLQS